MSSLSKKKYVYLVYKKENRKEKDFADQTYLLLYKRDKKHDFLHVCNFNTKHKIFLNTLKYVLTPKIIIQNLEL